MKHRDPRSSPRRRRAPRSCPSWRRGTAYVPYPTQRVATRSPSACLCEPPPHARHCAHNVKPNAGLAQQQQRRHYRTRAAHAYRAREYGSLDDVGRVSLSRAQAATGGRNHFGVEHNRPGSAPRQTNHLNGGGEPRPCPCTPLPSAHDATVYMAQASQDRSAFAVELRAERSSPRQIVQLMQWYTATTALNPSARACR